MLIMWLRRPGAQELDEAFRSSFIGESAQWMKDAIEKYTAIYRKLRHYGKMIAYVQSSATGKSRTLEELSTQVRCDICLIYHAVIELLYLGSDDHNLLPRYPQS